MMAFGWRPQQSCYQGADAGPTCPTATWFWLLLGGAVVWGFKGKKRQA